VATGRSATSAGTARNDDLDATVAVLADADHDRTGPVIELPTEPLAEPAPAAVLRPPQSAPADVVDATRIYDGRPVRLARTIRMRVTAYSPDERSCGASADGITASGYSVSTNGGCLVAADPKVLPLGSILGIPGYDGGECVPVLDVGGAIKGNRLDVLFPTHEQAIAWGVRELDVEVWEFADGKPSGFRKLRRPR
jgi:3D (Asp-Asp-Asp) domain-containing protein